MLREEVLVADATTPYGVAVAHSLLQAGWAVRALVADLAHPAAEKLRRRGARLAWCPVPDATALAEALEGVSIVCAGAYERADAQADTARWLRLADVARGSVRHFIFSSYPAAQARTGVLQLDSRHEVERFLQASGLRHTIVCPGLFMEQLLDEPFSASLLRGVLPLAQLNGHALQLIALDDAVRFLRVVVERPAAYEARRVVIASDELTPIEMAAVLARTAGRGIHLERMPDALLSRELQASAAAPHADVTELRRLHPEVNWHTLEGWAHRQQWRT